MGGFCASHGEEPPSSGAGERLAEEELRRQRNERERQIAALATRQYGVISRQQLLAAGLSPRAIERRLETGHLHRLHRGVYALGHVRLSQRSHWMAGVLACGDDAVLSYKSAAYLWGLMRARGSLVEVSAPNARHRDGIATHQSRLDRADRTRRDGIPVTTVARTLTDLAEVVDEKRLRRAFEEADRLGLLRIGELEELRQRRRLRRPLCNLIEAAREPPKKRSPLENRFAAFCEQHRLPVASTNVLVRGFEVDAFWPAARLVVELDSFSFHGHRAAFERDRAKDAALQVAGYRVIRVTHRRLEDDPASVAAEIRSLLQGGIGPDPASHTGE